MWNPRLISEDVGVGVNVRQLRRYFLRYNFHFVYIEVSFYFCSAFVLSCSAPLPSSQPCLLYKPLQNNQLKLATSTIIYWLCITVINSSHLYCSSFSTVYSMRPLAAGAVFRCYPG